MTPGWREMTYVFGRIGVLSFGGPAAQIALMHDSLVTRHKWLSEQQYLRALSLCMLLPGPEAMQLATYAGWRLRGTAGGLLAGLLFVVPGALVILALALGYVWYGDLPLVRASFLGIKAAVIVIVLQALMRLARKALTGPAAWTLALSAFVALFALGLPFPVIVLAAGLYGYVTARPGDAAPQPATSPTGTMRTIILWSALWAAPLLVCWFFAQTFLVQIGLFFSKLAVVTFGGAYAVLAYMTQEVVQNHGWIETGQMIDALGLAETTPGPLILVTEFVALLAGYAQGGLGLAIAAGALTLWVTFIPCFLWIFAAGPYVDLIAARPRLSAALQAI
ncbi:MAG: chromate efflux transporter, partial [Planctomycetota bacterium]